MLNFSSKKLPWIIETIGLTACILSIIIASLHAAIIDLFYVAIISIFLSILFRFIITKATNTNFTKDHLPLIVFLLTYILLVIWLGLSKVIPEYTKMTTFEKERNALVYEIMSGDKDDEVARRLKLAKHYLSAPTVIIRNEARVRHKGAKMMEILLTEKLEQNLGSAYRHDMFYLAEFAYRISPNDISKRWYKNAYDAGRWDALEREKQRKWEDFKDIEVDRLDALERYNEQMREKYEHM